MVLWLDFRSSNSDEFHESDDEEDDEDIEEDNDYEADELAGSPDELSGDAGMLNKIFSSGVDKKHSVTLIYETNTNKRIYSLPDHPLLIFIHF